MLDPKLLRENPELVRGMLANRKFEFPLDHLIALDKRRRELILQVEKFKHRKNLLARVISTKIKNHQDTVPEREEMTGIGAELADIEQEKKTLDAKFRTSMMTLPNLINKSVPIGSDEKENVILRYHGAITNFDFFLKDHVDIANSLGLLDIERAAKIAGARFYFLKNELVKLNLALINYALDFLAKKGYNLAQPPFMIRREAMEGAVILGDVEDMIYKIEKDDLYMIGTSEHSMASMHMNEIFNGKVLPLRYASISPCFRKKLVHTARTRRAFSGFINLKKLNNLFTHGLKNQNKNMNDCWQYLRNSMISLVFHIGQFYYVPQIWGRLHQKRTILKRGCQVKMHIEKSSPVQIARISKLADSLQDSGTRSMKRLDLFIH